MEYKFKYKFVKSAPRKVRVIANLVKNMAPEMALTQLKFLQKHPAKHLEELIKTGLATVKEKKINQDNLIIKSLQVDQGPMLKRRHYRSRGRADIIRKKMSHITLVLSDKTEKQKNIKTKNL